MGSAAVYPLTPSRTRRREPRLDRETFDERLAERLASGTLFRRGALLAQPGHRAKPGYHERIIWERLKPP